MPSGPTTLALPAFQGATRRLILIHVVVFFADAILGLVLPAGLYRTLYQHLLLVPAEVLHGQVWQLATYAFVPLGWLGTLFAMLTLWFVGSMLEEARGARWLYEMYLTSIVGGALLAVLVAWTGLFRLDPALEVGLGPYAGLFALLVGVAVLMGEQEFLLLFLIRIKAKYLVAIYILVDLAQLLKSSNTFAVLLHLAGALCGYLFLRFVPRRGLAYGVTERYFAARNDFYRSKRRRAARKFEVYMGKQGRDVRFDRDGRYIDPDLKKDPNDKSWMN